jgi:hypothetical protein
VIFTGHFTQSPHKKILVKQAKIFNSFLLVSADAVGQHADILRSKIVSILISTVIASAAKQS